MSMKPLPWETIVPDGLPTPCFVVDADRLRNNLDILGSLRSRTGAKVLLALKAFAMFSTFGILRPGLDGTCASSPHEALLGREEFGGEVHAFAAAYSEEDIEVLAGVCDHILFNSFEQKERFLPLATRIAQAQGRSISFGLRINPEHSEGTTPIYDPCSPGSRLGMRLNAFTGKGLEGISGLHFHTLCEQDAAPLARTFAVVEKNFGPLLRGMSWLNMGGGHHITRPGYDLDLLCRTIEHAQRSYGVQVYLEPGEAVALNSGVLVSTVLDVVQADMPIAILDTSAAAHMPDVLEMPYRPEIIGAGEPFEKSWTCRLTGKSCLAGDIIGEYSFDAPLHTGDRLIFLDMAHYSMVKTTTFNGLGLPAIALAENGQVNIIRRFGYEDFKSRLS